MQHFKHLVYRYIHYTKDQRPFTGGIKLYYKGKKGTFMTSFCDGFLFLNILDMMFEKRKYCLFMTNFSFFFFLFYCCTTRKLF